jgi:TrpR family trp operon transcriptional repressor
MKKENTNIEQYKKEVVDIIRKMAEDRKSLSDLLIDLLTPGELREIALRWQIIKRLKDGDGQRDVAQNLGIGLATVSRGARALLNPTGGFSQALRKEQN